MKVSKEMKIEGCVLDELVKQITSHDTSYEDVEGCTNSSNLLIDQFQDKLNELKSRGPQAQLCAQYFETVSVVLDFIRAKRLGPFESI